MSFHVSQNALYPEFFVSEQLIYGRHLVNADILEGKIYSRLCSIVVWSPIFFPAAARAAQRARPVWITRKGKGELCLNVALLWCVCHFCLIWSTFEKYRQISIHIFVTQCHENRCGKSRPVLCGQTDVQTDEWHDKGSSRILQLHCHLAERVFWERRCGRVSGS